MEYHYIVKWSEENGWSIDWESTLAKFDKGKTVYIPNINEWVFPDHGSETGDQEQILIDDLDHVFDQLNKGDMY
jgi:hypothetical protein